MHDYNLLELLAIGFFLALIFGYIAHKFGLSPIVGYLFAGFLAGPYTPGFIADAGLATQLSEAGVILLMFGVGLHFNTEDLLAVKAVSIPGAIVQSTAATLCGAWAAHFFGLGMASGILLGLGLSVASTVVLLRVLTDNGMLDTVHGHVAVGWLVVEDIFTVLILVILPGVAAALNNTDPAQTISALTFTFAILKAILNLVILWILVLVVGGRVVPWLLIKVARTRSQELFTLTVLVAAFAIAVGAAVFFDASMALGAFLGGMVVGKSRLSHQAGADLLPMRDAFAVLFFLSVGMLFNPEFLIQQPWLILACLLIVLIIKPLTAIFVVSILGYSAKTALTVATGLAQIGEFSFILAQVAQSLGLIPHDVYNVLVVCGLISITFNPSLVRSVPKIEMALQKHPWIWNLINRRADRKANTGNNQPLPKHHEASAIVIGYGPTGKSVAKALTCHNMTPVIIDLNVDTVNDLNDRDEHAIFGDSTKREILVAAGIEHAHYLIITIPVIASTLATAALARTLNPDIRIFVRTRFLNDNPLLQQIGVTGIAFEEEEVARALTYLLLEDVAQTSNEISPATS